MWTPFWDGSRSTVQSIVAEISFSPRPRPISTAFWTPVTPARERPIRTSGAAAWRSSSGVCVVSVTAGRVSATVPGGPLQNDTSFSRLVSLACHDVRTPLATVHGFVKTLSRTVELDPPADRYVEMIAAASAQIAELLDELSLAARIEGARYEPVLRETDTLELAHAAAERLGDDRVHVSGEGATIETDRAAVDRGVSALVQAALRHGGLDEVDVVVARARAPT